MGLILQYQRTFVSPLQPEYARLVIFQLTTLPQDVTKSSAKAFRVGRFNYTVEMQNQEVQMALASSNSVNPFSEPSAWPGKSP